MDERTLSFYAAHAADVADLYRRGPPSVTRYLRMAFSAGDRVLDIGSGTGLGMAQLIGDGVDAYGLEPVAEMIQVTLRHHPDLAGRIWQGGLPDGIAEGLGNEEKFDGVLCSAVLQHLPRSELFEAVFAIKQRLEAGGRLLVSIPLRRDDVDEHQRSADDRLFNGVRPEELERLLSRIGFVTIGRWDEPDGLGRPGIRWAVRLMRLAPGSGHRPLDRIEGVLRDDRKVTTYKFALLRALAEIATTEPGRVDWQSGGLTAFALDQRNQRFSDRRRVPYTRLLSKLEQVIKDGPVQHSGGSLESGRLFGTEGHQILIEPDLWTELSLTGYWIQDALHLRWAEAVARLSQQEVPVEQVVAALLQRPIREREVADARHAYRDLPSKECVCTGRRLADPFHVDQVIPFALWQNNDLWNLMPAHPKTNLRKGDKLPALQLLRKREGTIVRYWDYLRTLFPQRFEREASTLQRHTDVSTEQLFGALVENVETTALQRAAGRFAG